MKKIALSLFVIAASGAYVWDQSGRRAADDLLGSAPPNGDVQTGSIEPGGPMLTATGSAVTARPVPFVTDATLPSPGGGDWRLGPSAASIQLAKKLGELPKSPPVAAPPLPTANVSAAADAPRLPPAQDPPAALVADVPFPRPRPEYHPISATVTRVAMSVAANASYADGTFTGPAVDAYYGLVQIQAIVQGGQLVAIKALRYPSDRRTSVYINRQALPMLRDEVVSAQSANVDIISGATLTSEAFIRSLDSALRKAVRT